MVLSDRDVRLALKRKPNTFIKDPSLWSPLVIDPLDESRIQPASIDLTLDNEFAVYAEPYGDNEHEMKENGEYIDLDHVKDVTTYTYKSDYYYLRPGQFILGSTVERVEIPDDLCARVEGKSSLGRIGLLVHLTAGYIDPGFKGKITLEIVNTNEWPIMLRAGKPICQLSIIQLSSRAEEPYGHENRNSKYQDQKTVQGSLYAG